MRFNILPPVVKNLIIINAIFFFATVVTQDKGVIDLTRLLGLHFIGSDYFQPHQIITYMFMHGGITHIFFNMFALFMFGNNLENIWGPKRFLIYYMVTGIGAAIIHQLYTGYDLYSIQASMNELVNSPSAELFSEMLNKHYAPALGSPEIQNFLSEWSKYPESGMYLEEAKAYLQSIIQAKKDMPTVGASGSVFGILLAFGMLFPNVTLMLIFPPIPIKAKYFVIGYGVIELYMGISNNPGDNVAHFAHLGGMLFGYVLIKFWNKNRFKQF